MFQPFWVFFVCSVLGLILEEVWHMVVVDHGVYQDRAGMLFGPFSPIYGFGAVLMTMALNRFYKKNPLIIFLVSALIGGAFGALGVKIVDDHAGTLAAQRARRAQAYALAGAGDQGHAACEVEKGRC